MILIKITFALLTLGIVSYNSTMDISSSSNRSSNTKAVDEVMKNELSDIKSKGTAIIVELLGVDESKVTPESSFTDDLGADDLDIVELFMAFEEEFNMAIPDERAENITTVGQAIKYIEENIN